MDSHPKICDWVRIEEGVWRCSRPNCRRVYKRPLGTDRLPPIASCPIRRSRASGSAIADAITRLEKGPIIRVGAGTELKALLRKLGINPSGGCPCPQHAKVMDLEGTTWCEAHTEEIIDWMEKEAKRRSLPFVRLGARVLVRLAIRRARKKEALLQAQLNPGAE